MSHVLILLAVEENNEGRMPSITIVFFFDVVSLVKSANTKNDIARDFARDSIRRLWCVRRHVLMFMFNHRIPPTVAAAAVTAGAAFPQDERTVSLGSDAALVSLSAHSCVWPTVEELTLFADTIKVLLPVEAATVVVSVGAGSGVLEGLLQVRNRARLCRPVFTGARAACGDFFSLVGQGWGCCFDRCHIRALRCLTHARTHARTRLLMLASLL